MAKLRSSYSLMKITSFGQANRKMALLPIIRNGDLGQLPSKAMIQLTNGNHYSGVGEKTPLAKEKKTSKDDWGGPEAEKLVIHLKDNFMESIKGYNSLLVYFYTTWCSHCKSLKSVYGEAAVKMTKDGIPGHLGAIDVTKRMDIADMFNIVAVPILKYFRNGEFIMIYNDKRTVDDIVKFMKNPPDKPLIVPKIDV